ncbi:MAG: trigger factor [Alphaproteobacteria bacterium]|nr:trigger factor [Alphaproteobacteria bacterium]
MQITEISNEALKRSYRVVLPAADIASQVDSRLEEMAKTASMPGFRPGKVPVNMLRRQYGQALFGEAVEKAVNESVGKTISDNQLKPALQPRIEVKKIEEGQDLEFEVIIELMPELGEIGFGDIELERLKVNVEDKQVDEAVERMASAQGELKPVEPTRAAEKGDTLNIDFTGFIDDVPFENGSAQGYDIELGSNSLIPGFEDQLIGAEVGQDRDVKVSFPADYGAAQLAGKEALFKVKVNQISTRHAKAIDDELAKGAGFDNIEAMRKAVRERIEQDYNQLSRALVKRKLLDKLADKHKFDVPSGLVDAEFGSIWQQVEEAKKNGQPVEGDEEKLKGEYRDIANRRVRLGLLLAEVGRKNNIEVTPQEINQAVIREAQRYPGQERQVFEFYGKNAEMRERLRAPIFEDKTIDFVLELAKVNDKPVSPDDLLKAAREGDEADKQAA